MISNRPTLLMVSNASSDGIAGGLNAMSSLMELSFEEYFQVKHIFIKDLNRFGKFRRIIQILLKLCQGKYDLVYFNSIYYFEFILFALICSVYKVPYQIHSHGSLSKFVFYEKSLKKFLLRPLLNYLVHKSESIIFSTTTEASNSICPQKNFLTIKNYINTQFKNSSRLQNRNKNKIVFISKIDWKYKGIHEMVEGFKRFVRNSPEFELCIYGYGNIKSRQLEIDKKDPAISRLLNAISNERQISFYGPIYGAAKWTAISDCGAVCLFSKSEAMPLILTESISAGTVILFSDSTNYQDIVSDPRMVCDGSAEGIEKILNIYKNNLIPNYHNISNYLKKIFETKLSDQSRKFELTRVAKNAIIAID